MLGAITGDVVGSRFEWHNYRSKGFTLFTPRCSPTNDSIMTLAVAQSILDCEDSYAALGETAVRELRSFGQAYPNSGYGGRFLGWLFAAEPKPYGSFGNGAAMRVSPCGHAARTVDEAKYLAHAVTAITHGHAEGLRAAEAVTLCIYHARQGASMDFLKALVRENYYRIDFCLDDIRDEYAFDETCQGSVPQAFEAFFESTDFEDAIRCAVSIGGDSDTIAAITGSLAEAYYGVPADIRERTLAYLDERLTAVVQAFELKYPPKIL